MRGEKKPTRLHCSKIWKVEKKLVRTNWERNNRCRHANQVKMKHETIDFTVTEHRRDLFDLSPELGEVTQPRAVVLSLVPMLCGHNQRLRSQKLLVLRCPPLQTHHKHLLCPKVISTPTAGR